VNGRGLDEEFGRQDNRSFAIAQYLRVTLDLDGGEAGMGAVAEAVVTEDTGARAIVSWATAGGVERGSTTNVGNCADSCALGLAAATS